jgi:molybdopterin molybdotransferase
MIQFKEALDLILGSAIRAEAEKADLISSAGRILAEDVISDMDMPPFNRAAVDGFACRKADLKGLLEVIEVLPAGKVPSRDIGKGQCTRIMTGGMVPGGADCIIMVEDTVTKTDQQVRFTGKKIKTNIAFKAEDVRKGDTVIKAGTLIKPQHIAVMAAVGWTKPFVYKKPVVGIISTGDEIVEPEIIPGISQIRNSNAWQLMAQVARVGAVPEYFGIVGDEKEATRQVIDISLRRCDMVILTGGVSMGDFDFVPEVFRQLNIHLIFESVAIQPGRPTVFGTIGTKRIFGLPGNPVSSFVVFELLVRPLLNKMMGDNVSYISLKLPMGEAYERKSQSRMQWLPVKIFDGEVFPLEFHGSAHIHSLVDADALAAIPIGISRLEKGEITDVRQI